jgi:hypothetical protein
VFFAINPIISSLHSIETAARDANNRVAATALFAGYAIGEEWTVPESPRMSGSELPVFRASAAPAMGETGDRRSALASSQTPGQEGNSAQTGGGRPFAH